MDDYEEGTWTPQLRGGGTNVGTTVLQAFYTKIGNVVHCEFNIQRNDSATNNNNMELTIYAVNYNVLRIMSGMGGLAYSN